jgi:hypothetical protein
MSRLRWNMLHFLISTIKIFARTPTCIWNHTFYTGHTTTAATQTTRAHLA